MELNTFTLSDFTSLFNIIWIDNQESLPMPARNSGIWRFIPVADNTGDSRRMSEMDLEEYAHRKAQGAQGERAIYQRGYTKDLTTERVALDVGVTVEMRKQNKYPEVLQMLTNLSERPSNRIELDLSHRISFATATSYVNMDGETVDITGGDSLSWAHTAHTVRGSTATYRNRLQNNPAISKGSIEALRRMVKENTINQFGQKKTVNHDILWTTDDEVDMNVVQELLFSTGNVDYSNSAIKNPLQSKYRHVVLPRVATDAVGAVDTTKRHYWGSASSMLTTAYLGVWEEPHNLPFWDSTDGSENMMTGVRAGYGICHVTGRGFALSTGDGQP